MWKKRTFNKFYKTFEEYIEYRPFLKKEHINDLHFLWWFSKCYWRPQEFSNWKMDRIRERYKKEFPKGGYDHHKEYVDQLLLKNQNPLLPEESPTTS